MRFPSDATQASEGSTVSTGMIKVRSRLRKKESIERGMLDALWILPTNEVTPVVESGHQNESITDYGNRELLPRGSASLHVK